MIGCGLCGECKFYVPKHDLFGRCGRNQSRGNCRRRAPDTDGEWPVVGCGGFCGDFREGLNAVTEQAALERAEASLPVRGADDKWKKAED